jgi:hypothetical protein
VAAALPKNTVGSIITLTVPNQPELVESGVVFDGDDHS